MRDMFTVKTILVPGVGLMLTSVLPRWYTVKDFMVDVKQWYNEGYIDRDIWSHLQSYVKADVLPVSDVTVTSGNTVVTATCSFSGREGTLVFYVLLF